MNTPVIAMDERASPLSSDNRRQQGPDPAEDKQEGSKPYVEIRRLLRNPAISQVPHRRPIIARIVLNRRSGIFDHFANFI
ncbi:hypothetical protein Pla8534_15680 [Lignipirellula cremea]|uniref:Uncharacterized protein n=1 Tax=Lignipirellula cremea TaxID=2528010 RepID=A0A518DPM2_9BACT|nr:hypothetical protein Pla8534_15680 [Lignipirellula cremea]